MKSTMVEGWPDAIRCSSGPVYGNTIFIIHWAGSYPGSSSSYRQIYSIEDRFVAFNADGTYQTRGGTDGCSAECAGKSIQQLYSEGRAFNFVDSIVQDNLGIASMVANWPDAIRCSSDPIGNGGSIFIIHGASNSRGQASIYRQIYSPEDRIVIFNVDGTYYGRGGDNGSSVECVGKSIQQLYSEERAFNFVSSRMYDNLGISTIIANWPDAIRCSSDPIGSSIYIVEEACNDPGTTSWYRQIISGEDRFIRFSSDGSYFERGGNNESSAECVGKSIQQLYSEGRAFNFIPLHNSNYGMFSKASYFIPMNGTDDTGRINIGLNINWCNGNNLYTGDFNGDGKTDLLCNMKDGENYIMLSNTTLFGDARFIPMNTTDPNGRIAIGLNSEWCNESFQKLFVGDFNGDKISDLLCNNNANIREGQNYVMLSNSKGFYPISLSSDGIIQIGILGTFCSPPGRLVVGNFDGAYGDDLLCNDPIVGNMLMVSSINETSKATIFKSVNEKASGNINMGNDQECEVVWCGDPAVKLIPGYFNDDNKADLLCNLNGSNMIMLSAINSSSACDFTAVQYGSSSPKIDGYIKIPTTDNPDVGLSWCDASSELKAGDIDGNGLTDIICNSQGQNKIMFCEFKDSYTTFVSINAADPEGDGSVDIANHHKWCLSQNLFMGGFTGDSLSDLWCNQYGVVVGA